jgi:membrane-associated phospholipid phosphatase
VRRLDNNGPKGLFVALALTSGAVLAALSVAVGTEGPIAGDGVVEFFDEHYYDVETVRRATKATVQVSIVLGVAFALALLGILLAARAYARAAFWGLAVGGAVVLTRVLKEAIERPEIGLRQAEYSFPSGNATVSLAGVVALVLLLPPSRLRRWIAIAGAAAVPLYGFALVFLLWHYPSDIVAGWALALAWVSALWLAFAQVR